MFSSVRNPRILDSAPAMDKYLTTRVVPVLPQCVLPIFARQLTLLAPTGSTEPRAMVDSMGGYSSQNSLLNSIFQHSHRCSGTEATYMLLARGQSIAGRYGWDNRSGRVVERVNWCQISAPYCFSPSLVCVLW